MKQYSNIQRGDAVLGGGTFNQDHQHTSQPPVPAGGGPSANFEPGMLMYDQLQHQLATQEIQIKYQSELLESFGEEYYQQPQLNTSDGSHQQLIRAKTQFKPLQKIATSRPLNPRANFENINQQIKQRFILPKIDNTNIIDQDIDYIEKQKQQRIKRASSNLKQVGHAETFGIFHQANQSNSQRSYGRKWSSQLDDYPANDDDYRGPQTTLMNLKPPAGMPCLHSIPSTKNIDSQRSLAMIKASKQHLKNKMKSQSQRISVDSQNQRNHQKSEVIQMLFKGFKKKLIVEKAQKPNPGLLTADEYVIQSSGHQSPVNQIDQGMVNKQEQEQAVISPEAKVQQKQTIVIPQENPPLAPKYTPEAKITKKETNPETSDQSNQAVESNESEMQTTNIDIRIGSPTAAGGISLYAFKNIIAEETQIIAGPTSESQITKTNQLYSTMTDHQSSQLFNTLKARKKNESIERKYQMFQSNFNFKEVASPEYLDENQLHKMNAKLSKLNTVSNIKNLGMTTIINSDEQLKLQQKMTFKPTHHTDLTKTASDPQQIQQPLQITKFQSQDCQTTQSDLIESESSPSPCLLELEPCDKEGNMPAEEMDEMAEILLPSRNSSVRNLLKANTSQVSIQTIDSNKPSGLVIQDKYEIRNQKAIQMLKPNKEIENKSRGVVDILQVKTSIGKIKDNMQLGKTKTFTFVHDNINNIKKMSEAKQQLLKDQDLMNHTQSIQKSQKSLSPKEINQKKLMISLRKIVDDSNKQSKSKRKTMGNTLSDSNLLNFYNQSFRPRGQSLFIDQHGWRQSLKDEDLYEDAEVDAGEKTIDDKDHTQKISYITEKATDIQKMMLKYDISEQDLNSKMSILQFNERRSKSQLESIQEQQSELRKSQSKNKTVEFSFDEIDPKNQPFSKQMFNSLNPRVQNLYKQGLEQAKAQKFKPPDGKEVKPIPKLDGSHKKKPTPSQLAAQQIDHINANIKLATKINSIKQIKVFAANLVTEQNINSIKHFKNKRDDQFREISQKQLDRWEDFKQRRTQIIDMYIKVSRIKYKVKEIIKLTALSRIVRTYAQHVAETQQARREVFSQVLVYLRFCALWKFRLCKFGPKQLHHVFLNRTRQAFTFAGILHFSRNTKFKQKCFRMIKATVDSYNYLCFQTEFKARLRAFFASIGFIQRRIKDKLQTQDAKCEILRNYWNRVLFWLFKQSNVLKDENMNKTVKAVTAVPRHISDEVIKAFVKKGKERHAVAFLQWRLFYSKSATPKEELQQIIQDRVNYMEHSFQRRRDFILQPETHQYGTMEIGSNKTYDFVGKVYAMKIDTLESIGWPDPFPYPLPEVKQNDADQGLGQGVSKKLQKQTLKKKMELIAQRGEQMQLFDDIDIFIPPRADQDDDGSTYSLDTDNNEIETESAKERYYRKRHTHNLIYKKFLIASEDSPQCIYLPSKECLFKIMRACIGVCSIEDLWFNQGVEEKEEEERVARLAIHSKLIAAGICDKQQPSFSASGESKELNSDLAEELGEGSEEFSDVSSKASSPGIRATKGGLQRKRLLKSIDTIKASPTMNITENSL